MSASSCAHLRIYRPWFRGVLLTCGLLTGCAAPPDVALQPHPADPHARAPAVGYRSTTAPYVSRRPVAPAPWREQNERVAPAPGS
jgi:hypothetical protein